MAAITHAPPDPGRNTKKRQPVLTEPEERARHALDLLVQWSGLTNAQVGERVQMSGERVRQRRDGQARIRYGDVIGFADALNVAPECFGMTVDELVDWIYTDTRGRDLLIASSRCILLLAS